MVDLTTYRTSFFFFFNDTATTEIYTLALHDALPISGCPPGAGAGGPSEPARPLHPPPPGTLLDALGSGESPVRGDRKSTRLNSSHANISYAVFCLNKKVRTPP